VVYAHSTISSKLLGFVVSAMRPTLPPGQAARRGHPAGERSPGDNCCKIAIAPRIKCSKTSFANLRHAGKFDSRLLGPTNLSCIVAEKRTFEALRLSRFGIRDGAICDASFRLRPLRQPERSGGPTCELRMYLRHLGQTIRASLVRSRRSLEGIFPKRKCS